MGNRAVLATRVKGVPKQYSRAIYLHWNGGRDSVEGFLKVINDKLEVRGDDYGWARLIQTITVIKRMDQDNFDNGVYWLDCTDKGWEIVGREFFENRKEQQEYPLEEMVAEIWERFPKCYHDPDNISNKIK